MYFLAIVMIAVPFYRLGGRGGERYKINLVKDPHDAKLSLCHFYIFRTALMAYNSLESFGEKTNMLWMIR